MIEIVRFSAEDLCAELLKSLSKIQHHPPTPTKEPESVSVTTLASLTSMAHGLQCACITKVSGTMQTIFELTDRYASTPDRDDRRKIGKQICQAEFDLTGDTCTFGFLDPENELTDK